ncbi:hypothetical protein ACFLS1_00405, partial [Verrucomicrobiota bacterium]
TEEFAAGAMGMKRLRNYYGIYKIYEKGDLRYLQHGTTQHGRQYIAGPKKSIPLGYYHYSTPPAQVLLSDNIKLKRIGMIGLGTGALATYVCDGQMFDVYELDPDNLPIAQENFTYLSIAENNGAKLKFVFGDGRVALQPH